MIFSADALLINPPLRFTNEPARHKLLDLVGDLSLLGQLPTAHVITYRIYLGFIAIANLI